MMNTGMKEADTFFRWFEKAKKYFEPFKPELKSQIINYRSRKGEINLLLNVPDNLRREFAKIEVPAYQNFVITEMIDGVTFSQIGSSWFLENGKWKLDASKLPVSEHYLVKLEGHVPEYALERLVRIQPSSNRDQTEEEDKYWLSSMLRNAELFEKIWRELLIEDITVGVKVSIEKAFSVAVPVELVRRFTEIQKWIEVGRGRDKEKVVRQWSRLRSVSHLGKSDKEYVETIDSLTEGETFGKYVSVDDPYRIGEIRRSSIFKGIFPESMHVDTNTILNLRNPTAKGYLVFKKRKYSDEIRRLFK